MKNDAQELFKGLEEASEERMAISDLKVCKDFTEVVFVLDSQDGQERWWGKNAPLSYTHEVCCPVRGRKETTEEVEKSELGQAV